MAKYNDEKNTNDDIEYWLITIATDIGNIIFTTIKKTKILTAVKKKKKITHIDTITTTTTKTKQV